MNDACAEFGERYVLPAAPQSATATRTRSVPDEEMEPVGAGK
jgi:hypothetical protein